MGRQGRIPVEMAFLAGDFCTAAPMRYAILSRHRSASTFLRRRHPGQIVYNQDSRVFPKKTHVL